MGSGVVSITLQALNRSFPPEATPRTQSKLRIVCCDNSSSMAEWQKVLMALIGIDACPCRTARTRSAINRICSSRRTASSLVKPSSSSFCFLMFDQKTGLSFDVVVLCLWRALRSHYGNGFSHFGGSSRKRIAASSPSANLAESSTSPSV